MLARKEIWIVVARWLWNTKCSSFAELNFHVCQFHFPKLWNPHCPSWSFLFAKIAKSTLPNSKVNMVRSTFPSWQLHIAILSNSNNEKLEVGIYDLLYGPLPWQFQTRNVEDNMKNYAKLSLYIYIF